MKLQKQIIVALFVALFFFSFTAHGEIINTVMINGALNTNDAFVDNVLKIYEQLPNCDGTRIEAILDNNVVWEYKGPLGAVPFAGIYQGREGVKSFWRTFFSSVNNPRAELRYSLHDKNVVDLHWIEEGFAKSTGKRYLMETVQRWEFNDMGKLVKFKWYNDTFAMYHAFQPNTDPSLSLAPHPADYHIIGANSINGKPMIEEMYNLYYLKGDLNTVFTYLDSNVIYTLAGPQSITPYAGTYIGLTEFQNAVITFWQTSYYVNISFYNFIGEGCKVDAEFVDDVLIYSTGKVVPCSGMHSIILNSQGKIVKFRSYNDSYSLACGF